MPQAPGATRIENGPATALQRWTAQPCSVPRRTSRETGPAFYLSAAPRLARFEHLVINQAPGDHPGNASPSRFSDTLRQRTARSTWNGRPQSVTSLAGVTPRLILVRLRLPPERSFRSSSSTPRGGTEERFRQSERRSSRLPAKNECSPFGTVSDWAHWQGLSPLSSLSYSQSALFKRSPGLMIPVPAVTSTEAPDAR